MKLSVIIVSYNVRDLLEQCLCSVLEASQNIETEVFVVDNNSNDNSPELVKQKFPRVNLIQNPSNVGFSVANNQAIKIAKGEFILLLNPDTLVAIDTFEKTISFMQQHPNAGALGVKMVDGEGRFLLESKRSLPTPLVAFYKMIGLANIFPKSKVFSKYHLGYLNENKTHEVDILAGAFMLIRKSVLDVVGLLDETFFMYGEDIDLSYRILLAGYKNYYFPEITITHFKGQSTNKESYKYVVLFYKAMLIFYKKHFSKKGGRFIVFFISVGIYLRGLIALANQAFKKIKI